jgi:hypothetical protein
MMGKVQKLSNSKDWKYIAVRTATIWDGVWIDNWIYWTQLNYTTRDYTLQFTVRHAH